MSFHAKTIENCINALNSDIANGLTNQKIENSRLKHGKNVLSKKKKQTFFISE